MMRAGALGIKPLSGRHLFLLEVRRFLVVVVRFFAVLLVVFLVDFLLHAISISSFGGEGTPPLGVFVSSVSPGPKPFR